MSTATPKVEATPQEYIEIPKVDLFDHPFDGIWINKTRYAPGTHLVDADIAAYLKDRLKIWQNEQIRQLRPNSDPRVRASQFEK